MILLFIGPIIGIIVAVVAVAITSVTIGVCMSEEDSEE